MSFIVELIGEVIFELFGEFLMNRAFNYELPLRKRILFLILTILLFGVIIGGIAMLGIFFFTDNNPIAGSIMIVSSLALLVGVIYMIKKKKGEK